MENSWESLSEHGVGSTGVPVWGACGDDSGTGFGDELAVPGAVEDLLGQVLGVADELVGLLPHLTVAGLGSGGLLEAARVFQQVANMVEAKNVELAHQLVIADKQSDLAHRVGTRNVAGLLQETTGLSGRDARSRLRLAQAASLHTLNGPTQLLSHYPRVQQAFSQGELTAGGARRILETLERAQVQNPQLLEAAEEAIVQSGTGKNANENTVRHRLNEDALTRACANWEKALRPDGTCPKEEEKAHARRSLTIGPTIDGVAQIRINALPETSALLARIIDAINNPKVQDPSMDAEGTKIVDPRTPTQKRYDALAAALAVAAKSRDLPTLNGAPVTVLIQTNDRDLHDPTASARILGQHGHFSPVPTSLARHALCAGTTQMYLQDAAGEVTALSVPARVFSPHQRKAILIRDGGCIIPGCTTPATWCEIHHVKAHKDGGQTTTTNGVSLCWHHHRTLGPTGWQIRLKNGEIQTKPPPPHAQTWLPHQPKHKPPPATTTG